MLPVLLPFALDAHVDSPACRVAGPVYFRYVRTRVLSVLLLLQIIQRIVLRIRVLSLLCVLRVPCAYPVLCCEISSNCKSVLRGKNMDNSRPTADRMVRIFELPLVFLSWSRYSLFGTKNSEITQTPAFFAAGLFVSDLVGNVIAASISEVLFVSCLSNETNPMHMRSEECCSTATASRGGVHVRGSHCRTGTGE